MDPWHMAIGVDEPSKTRHMHVLSPQGLRTRTDVPPGLRVSTKRIPLTVHDGRDFPGLAHHEGAQPSLLAGIRHTLKVLENRPFPAPGRIPVVCDNLNSHKPSRLHDGSAPAIADRMSQKLRLVHTPKPVSWLQVLEIEHSILSRL